ncbi:MAG: pepsin/retropepsin-like aspartic protease family protein [Saprospiraceae bacterium]
MKWMTKEQTGQIIDRNPRKNFKSNLLPKILSFVLICFCNFSPLSVFTQSPVAYLKASVKSEKEHELPVSIERGIPFELVRGMIVTQARIDDQDGQFILDTGAPLMVINDKPSTPSRVAASFRDEIAVGETTIKAFDWAGTEEKSLNALVLDISHLESAFERPLKGMIGFNAIKDYEVFFDYEDQSLLRCHPRKNVLHQNARPLHTIRFQLYDHLPVIVIKVGDKTLRFGLDTGACDNLLDESVLSGLDPALFTYLEDEAVQGLDQKVNRVRAITVNQMVVEDLPVLSDLKFLSTDLPQLRDASGNELDGLLGYSFLSRMKFSINYPKRKIYVWEMSK